VGIFKKPGWVFLGRFFYNNPVSKHLHCTNSQSLLQDPDPS